MMGEILKRSMIGIAFSGIATFIALTIMKLLTVEATVNEIWTNMLGSLIIGVYFGLSSFILESHLWSPLKKTLIHYCLSLLIYYCIAIPVGWIPFTPLYIGLGVLLFTVVYAIFWLGAYLFYTLQAKSMNAYLEKGD